MADESITLGGQTAAPLAEKATAAPRAFVRPALGVQRYHLYCSGCGELGVFDDDEALRKRMVEHLYWKHPALTKAKEPVHEFEIYPRVHVDVRELLADPKPDEVPDNTDGQGRY